MSSSKLGRRSSARSRPRWEKASRQAMPLSNSCMPLMIVWRFQPSSCSARRWPPRPRSFTVRAMKRRRRLPLRVRAVSVRWRLPSSVSRMVLDLQCQGGGLLYGAFFSRQVPYLLDGKVVSSKDFQKALRFLARDEEDDLAAGSVADELDAVAEAKAYIEGLPTVDLNQYDLRKLTHDVEADVKFLKSLYERTEALAAEDGKLERLKAL